jgi:acetylglutamate kinase
LVDPKLIFKKALDCLASKIILVHNHPSGTLKPSYQDINITQKIQKGGKLLDILIDDHIISDGMLPKLNNCFHAIHNNVSKVCIGKPDMLLTTNTRYTTIQK